MRRAPIVPTAVLLAIAAVLLALAGCGRNGGESPTTAPPAAAAAAAPRDSLPDAAEPHASAPGAAASGADAPGAPASRAAASRSSAPRPNVLLVIADDLGVDRVACYREHPDPGRTPVIDALAARGVLFRNVWSSPVCSATRATLLTGRYGFRTGIGWNLPNEMDAYELPLGEVTLPEVLAPAYASIALGKWHLSRGQRARHPRLQGFQHFRGTLDPFDPRDADAYTGYTKFADDERSRRGTTYATTDTVDDALELIPGLHEPWLAWLGFHAPHEPFHKPPAALHGYTLPPAVEDDIPLHLKAMVEALDTELGRLLDSLDPELLARTVVIFVGDNGTAGRATTPPTPPARSKSTLFQGGIHVPLLIAGPGVVQGAECAALVNTTDLFATIVELAGAAVPAGSGQDAISLVPYFSEPGRPSLRTFVYAEAFEPNGVLPLQAWRRTVRDGRFKLIAPERGGGDTDSAGGLLFDLGADPLEQDNLLDGRSLGAEAEAALARLREVLRRLQPTAFRSDEPEVGEPMPPRKPGEPLDDGAGGRAGGGAGGSGDDGGR
jgi:arylsulfatase A-like enzyme